MTPDELLAIEERYNKAKFSVIHGEDFRSFIVALSPILDDDFPALCAALREAWEKKFAEADADNLRRQRDEARLNAAEWEQDRDQWIRRYEDVVHERDEARADLAGKEAGHEQG